MLKSRVLFFAVLGLFVSCVSWAAEEALVTQKIGDYDLRLNAEDRVRYEFKSDADFNKATRDNGSVFYQRARIGMAAVKPKEVELMVELIDARAYTYQMKKPAQVDEIDLHQAYVKIMDPFSLPISLKLGRQEIQYGKGRLIAASSWSNLIRSFDGAILKYKSGGLWVDGMVSVPVVADNHNFDNPKEHEIISAVYLNYQKDKKSPTTELYIIGQVDKDNVVRGDDLRYGPLERYTAGFRVAGKLDDSISYDLEAPYQFGTYGSNNIAAYAFHLDLSKSLEAMMDPVITLEFNLASGDEDPTDGKTNTFVPIYQGTHDPYGIMDLYRWQNMREIAGKITLSPDKKLKIIPGVNFVWLDSKRDSWYNTSGTAVRTDTTGNSSAFLGTEVSIVAKYDLNKNVKLEGGVAHMFSGEFIHDTGARNEPNWVYTQVGVKF